MPCSVMLTPIRQFRRLGLPGDAVQPGRIRLWRSRARATNGGGGDRACEVLSGGTGQPFGGLPGGCCCRIGASYCVHVRRRRHAQSDSAAAATVIRTNQGSFASCIPSAMMRKRCASVSNPNTVPVVTTYAFILEPPDNPGHEPCGASAQPTAAAVLRNLSKCPPACYDAQQLDDEPRRAACSLRGEAT